MKDLKGVADLIEEAFANDLDRFGQNALQELRWLSRFKPVLWWMIYFNPDHSDFLSGFVWEEEGKVVGNITVNRTSLGSRRWLISNLAVYENYRGRGIGRSLMDAALELVEEYNGISVSLQVRANNLEAKRLYQSLGFKEISGTTYLRTGRVPRIAGIYELPKLPKALSLRPRRYNSQDTNQAYNLACAATPPVTQKDWPLYRHHFQLGSQQHLSDLLCTLVGSGSSAHWVVEDGQRFVGLMDIQPGSFRQPHHLRLIVHPDWRGFLEKFLIGHAFDYLFPWRNRSIIIKHPAEHTEAVEVYKEFGFQEEQTLLWMKREM
ncbi:MAG: GNAT family N-acetyltransferase [Anaerolineae bacterium]|nr:GNAT family N-acetyltransferase [Anaerolineae bacterium]